MEPQEHNTPTTPTHPYPPRGTQKRPRKAELLDLSIDTIKKSIDLFIHKIGTEHLTRDQKVEVTKYINDIKEITSSYYYKKREQEVTEVTEMTDD